VKPGLVNEMPPCESASPDITKKRKFRYQQSITKIKHNYPNFHISPLTKDKKSLQENVLLYGNISVTSDGMTLKNR